jgi:hypothetical protein
MSLPGESHRSFMDFIRRSSPPVVTIACTVLLIVCLALIAVALNGGGAGLVFLAGYTAGTVVTVAIGMVAVWLHWRER